MRRRLVPHAWTLAIAVTLGAWSCTDSLVARNNDNPDIGDLVATADGITALVSGSYLAAWNADIGAGATIYQQLVNMGFESYSTLPGLSLRNSLPRQAIFNVRANLLADATLGDFSALSRNSRISANLIIDLDRFVASGRKLGPPGANERARSFLLFTNGVSLGNLALAYDSGAIATQNVPPDAIPPLSGAAAVMAAALTNLDSAVALASAVTTGLALPATWLSRAMTAADFIRFVRSYRARLRALAARTPAQRDAVDWTAVIADVENGITADVNLAFDPSTGWSSGYNPFHYGFLGNHQMTPMIIGMADTSGAYDAWLATPLSDRTPILIKTPDKRFPPGESRVEQQANSPAIPTSPRYFRNRSSGDTQGVSWGTSFYDFYRWQSIASNRGVGDYPTMTKAEMDMLAAEGYLRLGQIDRAAGLIDKYRTRAGLPALSGVVTNATMSVPGGRACVPHVPTPAGNATTCGTIFEAMKWEKRMETAFTGWTTWYFDSRGWGDLPEGTPLEFPVPYQELESRAKPFYNLGGIGGKSAAGKSNYGM